MKYVVKSGIAAIVIAAVPFVSQVNAADLSDWGGSTKDAPYAAPMSSSSNCYIRGDAGYSWNDEPDSTYVGNNPQANFNSVSFENSWLVEAGLGCGGGGSYVGGSMKDDPVYVKRGFRGEVMFGYRLQRDFSGEIPVFTNPDDPILTSIETYTLMLNIFHDFNSWGSLTPYVGAGIGFAYHIMDDVLSTDPNSPNPQFGDEDLQLAWSLMTGVAYRVGERTTLDLGYRYIDMGHSDSMHADTANAWNPRLDLDDLTAHEIKFGIRYDIGSIF